MTMRRRSSSRDVLLVGRRLLRSTGRDRDRDILPASPPPLTNRDVLVLTLMTTMIVVLGLLQEVAGLLVVMALIGRTYKKMMSEC
jgi:hypothetical protein